MTQPVRGDLGRPTQRLFGVVAALAQPLSVVELRETAATVSHGMVDMPDRGTTPRGAAPLVASDDEPAHVSREESAPPITVDDAAGHRIGVEPSHPHPSISPCCETLVPVGNPARTPHCGGLTRISGSWVGPATPLGLGQVTTGASAGKVSGD